MARFSETEILMGRAVKAELPDASQRNLERLTSKLNELFKDFKGPIRVSSGYRPPGINAAVGGATKSHHQFCAAADLADPHGLVRAYVLANLSVCQRLGLYAEDFRWTPGWVHIQIYPPGSGKRIFVPNAKKPTSPEAWNAYYDFRLDD